MEEFQKMLERELKTIPQRLLEKRLSERFLEAGVQASDADLARASEHLLSGNTETFHFGDIDDDVSIEITEDDIEYVVAKLEEFYKEKLVDVLHGVGDQTAELLYRSLRKRWGAEFAAQQEEMAAFKERLEMRWGKALGRLRMLLTIVMEWAQGAFERKQRGRGEKLSRLDDVLLRLHVRACQVTHEIIVLLENGYADGAMARWRTLHEIAITAAVIAKFGDDIAERYVHYQIVESHKAAIAYEQNHQALGFKPISKLQLERIRRDYDKVKERFGKGFGDEYGWAAHHLGDAKKKRVTFADLEAEAGDAMMRSPYKMASYSVHASPKGVYFKLGSLDRTPGLLAGASNAGLVEPGQHAAVSLMEITLLIINDSSVFDDIVVGKLVTKLGTDIPKEFGRANRRLRRDDRRHRQSQSPIADTEA